ncbi:MAG: hypothetical protein AAGI71_05200 [Bacteroidota bacterium]
MSLSGFARSALKWFGLGLYAITAVVLVLAAAVVFEPIGGEASGAGVEGSAEAVIYGSRAGMALARSFPLVIVALGAGLAGTVLIALSSLLDELTGIREELAAGNVGRPPLPNA